jgi:hypothetical protein
MKSWGARAQRLRVPVGTFLGIVFLLLMHPSIRSLWIGGSVAALGSLGRIWAAGHLDKGKCLACAGPYAHTRNPLYLGSFLMGLGVVLAGQAYWLLLPFGLFFAAFYYPVMRREEQELSPRPQCRDGSFLHISVVARPHQQGAPNLHGAGPDDRLPVPPDALALMTLRAKCTGPQSRQRK